MGRRTVTVAEVRLWGRAIGAVSWDNDRRFAHFEYDPAFVPSGRQVAPLTMPLASEIHSFPALPLPTFHGLPGLLADSLPDRFGNALIDAWLVRQGRDPGDFNAVERLCYIGARGMGALEFVPTTGPRDTSASVDVAALVELAGEILTERAALVGSLAPARRERALQEILRVGTSAGGARAKAVIAWNPSFASLTCFAARTSPLAPTATASSPRPARPWATWLANVVWPGTPGSFAPSSGVTIRGR